jgi:hypothetical protein
MQEIRSYEDFVASLLESGFSMGGGNSEGVFSVIPWNWDEPAPYETPVKWHTGDPGTDPWEWRMRVLEERDDIAYAKLFFKKSGYITKEWYPYFLAARRERTDFDEEYSAGVISAAAKSVYETLRDAEALPLHEIKAASGFSASSDKSRFDRAMTELQMKMHITMCGRSRKTSSKGEEYGWSSTVFLTAERFFGEEIFKKASEITKKEAEEKIREQILRLNPKAEEKKIKKFIFG